MKYPVVKLKRGEGRTLKRGGLWVYDNEIASAEAFENGGLVEVRDFDDYPMGIGFINEYSKIRVRLFTREPGEEIGPSFFRRALQRAWDYRKRVSDPSCCRVVFGEADFLPGLTIDKYGDVLVVESLALGIDRLKDTILSELRWILEEDGFPVRGIYERSDAKVRLSEGMERYCGFIGEPFDTAVRIRENGVAFEVDIAQGQKTGFFLDQKENRKAVGRLCPGTSVLDCFTHTGAFALNAAHCGAAKVLAVDASPSAIKQAERNASLNPFGSSVEFLCADVFEYLPKAEEAGERFDVVILDPPAFAKSRSALKKAEKGYREINIRGLRLVREGGFLATCSCSHFMTRELFRRMLSDAARGAHRKIRLVEERAQAPDHPVLFGSDESFYLKFFILQVL